MIQYGKQDINQQDIDAVVEVLQSDYLTQGPKVPEFENCLKEFCGVDYAVATNSATSALHIACLALGVAEGDEVWTSPNSFVASANCAIYCGARVDFVDIDELSYNLSVHKLEEKLKQRKQAGKPLPKVVIPVHFSGQPCDMEVIKKLSNEYGFKIIEDASHAIGGRCYDSTIGNCQYSDITVFSFHPVKIITSGEGGVAATNCAKLAEKLTLFRSHGVTREPSLIDKPLDGPWYYQQVALGFNYRMTELQAALGVSQFTRLQAFVERRHTLAKRYDELLKDFPIILPFRDKAHYSSLHLYVIQIDEKVTKSRREIFELLREQGIGVNVHYIPIHTQPFYQKMGFKPGDFPVAEAYYQKAISIPLSQTLTDAQQAQVVNALKLALI